LNRIRSKKDKLRYNIVSAIVYIIGIILLIQLFNLQILKGKEYRQQSNTRLSRESVLQAARGDILDQSGNKLATTKAGYVLKLYKTKIDENTLNSSLLKIVNVLEQNKDSYIDNLPIKVEPFEFTINEEEQVKWRRQNNIEETKTAEECFNILKEKYKITQENVVEQRKIMNFRYIIAKEGYSRKYGARNLNRTIIKLVENPVSEEILGGAGDVIVFDKDRVQQLITGEVGVG